jgi:hypothetical protein
VRYRCIACPYHGLRFTAEGKCILIPVNGAGARIPPGFDINPIPLREEHGLVWIWHGEPDEASPEIPWFNPAAWENGSVFRASFEVDVSYLRVMENMGDFFHVPFVHRATLPGTGTVLKNFDARVKDGTVRVSATLSPDGRKRWYNYEYSLYAELRLPAIARVREASKLDLIVAATPIDRDRTWMFVRYAQGYVPRWLGGSILARALAWVDINPIFRWGDLPTLRSQMLDDPGDISRYHLVEADRASALWFGMRERAIRESELRLDKQRVHLSAASS